MKFSRVALAAGALALSAGAAWSTPVTMTLVSTTPGGGNNVSISATPTGSPGNYRAVAQNYQETTTTSGLGAFVAWCLDLAATVSVGGTYNYATTDSPYTNSFGLSDVQRGRVQAMFDANYGSVFSDLASNAAAFQLALWEAAFEDDSTALSLADGVFRGAGLSDGGITSLATSYLTAAMGYLGGAKYDLTFLESTDKPRHQNLVTAAPVPLPAAAWLMIGGIGALVAAGRARRTDA